MTARFGGPSFAPALALAALALLAGCGGDDGPTGNGNGNGDPTHLVPASWGGIWDLEIVATGCGEKIPDAPRFVTDTLCVGEPFVLTFEEAGFRIDLECAGTIDDTSFDFVCSEQRTVLDCEVFLQAQLTGVRDGDTFTASGPFTVSSADDCQPPACADLEITATRTSTEQPGCGGLP